MQINCKLTRSKLPFFYMNIQTKIYYKKTKKKFLQPCASNSCKLVNLPYYSVCPSVVGWLVGWSVGLCLGESTGCSLNILFFQRIFESLPPLPPQHSAATGCTKNGQPIGVTVHSHCVESFDGLLQQKNTVFPGHTL